MRMRQSLLWIILLCIPVIFLGLLMFLLKDSVLSLDWSQLKVGDLVNLGALAIGFFGAFIAIASLLVAVSQLRQAVEDGKEQKKSLDASREQLQAVVESLKSQQHLQSQSLDTFKALHNLQERLVSTTKEQQDVLSQSLETSKTLLALQKEERERLQELANRKPKILALLGEVILENSKVEIPLTVEKETNRAYLPLRIRNVGTASLQKPSYVAHTTNREGTIWLEDTISNGKRPFHTEQSGLDVKDLLTFRGSGATYNSGIYIVAPATVSELDLIFSMTGENLDSPFVIEFHIHLNRT